MRRVFLGSCAFLLVCAMIPCFTACRDSAAFEQIVYNQDYEDDVVDDDTLNDNQPDNEDRVEMYSVAEEDDADKERHYENSEAMYDSKTDNDTALAANADYSQFASDNGETRQATGGEGANASSSSNNKTQNAKSSVAGTVAGSSDIAGSGSTKSNEDSNGSADKNAGTVNGGRSDTGDNENYGGIPNQDGNSSGYSDETSTNDTGDGDAVGKVDTNNNDDSDTKTPDETINPNDEPASAVIATGNAAILVQMLCGDDTLLGCDRETLNAMREYFPSSELSNVSALCSSPDDTISWDDVEKLSDNPIYFFYDVLDYNGTSTRNCNRNNCTPVALDFRYADGIEDAVNTMLAVLPSAEQKANDWLDLYEEIVAHLGDTIGTFTGSEYSYNVPYDENNGNNKVHADNTRTSGLYTIFVDGWDDDASITITLSSSGYEKTVSGVARVTYGYTGSPVSHFMSIAGVSNRNASANWAGSTNTKLYYLYNFGYTSCTVSVKPVADLDVNKWERSNDGGINQLAEGLGGADFPAVIAATQEIASKIETDRANEGSWSVYDYLNSTGMGNRGFYTVGNYAVISKIAGQYQIYTNPSGLGDWADGSAESILEAPWIASKFYPDEAYTEGDVEDLIRYFYQDFYRCDLSGNQMKSILAGKVS